jgi:hypothetical protein
VALFTHFERIADERRKPEEEKGLKEEEKQSFFLVPLFSPLPSSLIKDRIRVIQCRLVVDTVQVYRNDSISPWHSVCFQRHQRNKWRKRQETRTRMLRMSERNSCQQWCTTIRCRFDYDDGNLLLAGGTGNEISSLVYISPNESSWLHYLRRWGSSLYRCKDIEHITNIDLYKYTIILDEGRAECGVIILVNAIKWHLRGNRFNLRPPFLCIIFSSIFFFFFFVFSYPLPFPRCSCWWGCGSLILYSCRSL